MIFRDALWKLFRWKSTGPGRLTEPQLRQILGLETRDALDGFLKSHEVWLNFTSEDLDRERAALRRLCFGA